MKDKKFLVMLVLFGVWALGLVLAIEVGRFPKQIEYFVSAVCVGWFAYWSLSTVRDYFRKDVTPTPAQPAQPTQTNAKSKKTPKSD